MRKYYLAIDIGASSGRHILGYVENGIIKTEEVYRFRNGIVKKNDTLCWDVKRLFQEILKGLLECKRKGKIPEYMGIDTWAVDFVLLDDKGEIIGDSVAYRDHRTEGMDKVLEQYFKPEELYKKTGIQKQMFNTIYQLLSIKEKDEKQLDKAKSFLMIPDYFNYQLTNIMKNEYTNGTSTQLISVNTKVWDKELLERIGIPQDLFNKLVEPGTFIGEFTKEIKEIVGFNCKVIAPATHDTASAVMSVPSDCEDILYLSSGTWSLIGIETKEAILHEESRKLNFTNEGGYDYHFRYLKNIMGLWMIQSVYFELDQIYTYTELCDMASRVNIQSIVDCNDARFLSPDSMIQEIKSYCIETNQQIPKTPAEISAVIYGSLAKCYKQTIQEIESITGKTYDTLHIIGGGANAEYLNELVAKETGLTIVAGPIEATAIGNLLAQMLSQDEFINLQEARKSVTRSFQLKEYRNIK